MQTTHRLIFKDARKLDFLEEASIDLVVTSPPYPMIEMWDRQFCEVDPGIALFIERGEYLNAFEAMHALLDQIWQEVARVMKNGAYACINIGDATRTFDGRFRLYANHARIIKCFLELGFDVLPLILWRKQTNAPNKFMGSGMLPAGAYVTLEHEYILIFRKGSKRVFQTAADKHQRRQSSYFWEERNTWFSDLWDFKGTRQGLPDQQLRKRSGAFPLELPLRLINMYSLLEDTVLDPFAGTGSTTFAALSAGRNSIAVELDSTFSGLIKDRLFEDSDLLNSYNLGRITSHLDFIREYSKKQGRLKYLNNYFGFPVMTRQEQDLKLPFVRSVEETAPDFYSARYFDDHYVQGMEAEKLDLEYFRFDQGIQTRLDF